MRLPLHIALAATVLATATTAHAQMRYEAMDTNRDGIVQRAEWRGTDRAFRNEDWNGDGVLSGEEVRQGARRQNWSQDWNRDGRVDNLDAQISQRFRGYDMNTDNRVARSEWPGDQPLFTRLDVNRDNRISRFEFQNDTGAYQDTRYSPAQFNTFDANRDGWLTRPETRMAAVEFDRFDTNRDNRISRFEFQNVASASDPTNEPERSAAWRTGYDRGILEGRAAGREDFTRRQRWDLEGQRELEQADSGYTPQVGTLSDYQAGYREGFRNAYRAGFVEAGGRAPQ